MKRTFFIIISIMLLAIGILTAVVMLDDENYVARGGSSTLAEKSWDTVYAHYVNANGISIIADGRQVNAVMYRDVYMNDSRKMMLSEALIREVFDCSVNAYDENRIVLSSGEVRVQYENGRAISVSQSSKEEVSVTLDSLPEVKDGKFFIPAEMLVRGLGFSLMWNEDSRTAVFESGSTDLTDLRYYYSNADYGRLTSVKSQENLGVCWAFASVAALENTLLPGENWDFSEDHMIYNNPSGRGDMEGGDFLTAMSYLTSWKGPVKEEDDPYNDGQTDPDLAAVKHVQEIRFLAEKDYDTVKKMVFKYGAVETSVFIALEEGNYVSPEFYDYSSHGYCYDGNAEANHEVVIVGWDDDFPAEKLGGHAGSDGAFICRNSWGSSFGDNGIFYVGYDDAVIAARSEVYTRIDAPDNYDNIYQWERAGWNAQIGYGRNKIYAANVFTVHSDEDLKAVSLIATGPNTSYRIWICRNFKNTKSLDITGEPRAQGVFADSGYYTVDLAEPIELKENERFAVICEFITTGSVRPVAVNIPVDSAGSDAGACAGESYISSYGSVWESTQEKNNCTVCIKAFTTVR